MRIERKDAGTRTGVDYQKALDKLEVAERRLARHFAAWQKARVRVRSLGKRLDTLGTACDFKGCVTCGAKGTAVDFMGQCETCAPEPALGETAQARALARAAGY
jgi:hypothetical protein